MSAARIDGQKGEAREGSAQRRLGAAEAGGGLNPGKLEISAKDGSDLGNKRRCQHSSGQRAILWELEAGRLSVPGWELRGAMRYGGER